VVRELGEQAERREMSEMRTFWAAQAAEGREMSEMRTFWPAQPLPNVRRAGTGTGIIFA
jgi:hypothetical protein